MGATISTMRTHPNYSEDGELMSFEISTLVAASRALPRILAAVEGVTEIARPRGGGPHRDVRCEFLLEGIEFQIIEPFGDNSRYLVGPKDPNRRASELVRRLERAFSEHHSMLGNALTVVKLLLRRARGADAPKNR